MNDMLEELLGKTVEVRSGNTDCHDDGQLLAYDERWIKLAKETGEVIYFPIANIRLIKPLD